MFQYIGAASIPLFSAKEILIDAAGLGDLLLGIVIGALKPPDRRYWMGKLGTEVTRRGIQKASGLKLRKP